MEKSKGVTDNDDTDWYRRHKNPHDNLSFLDETKLFI